jgi:hypothetical protein
MPLAIADPGLVKTTDLALAGRADAGRELMTIEIKNNK